MPIISHQPRSVSSVCPAARFWRISLGRPVEPPERVIILGLDTTSGGSVSAKPAESSSSLSPEMASASSSSSKSVSSSFGCRVSSTPSSSAMVVLLGMGT